MALKKDDKPSIVFTFVAKSTNSLDKHIIHQFIVNALAEDVGDGDHTSLSTIPAGTQGKAKLIIKDNGILAGIELALEIFNEIDPQLKVNVYIKDGTEVKFGDIAFDVTGDVQSILKAERLVLNSMQRMSGIATTTNEVVDLLTGTNTRVLDTRKTTPGMRYLEKWAVKIEVRNLEELEEVLQAGGVDRILLDNFKFDVLKQAVAIIEGRYITEASGGITVDNVRDYADCGVDYVSMGSLTHSVKSLDMSLKAVKQ
jgi:nicotinate-nucleotide pyrophosphorylase (carboxylating)